MHKPKSNIARLALLMKPYIGKLAIALLCVLIVNAADLLKPVIAKIVIDDFLVGGKAQKGLYSVTGMGILYFAAAAAGALLSMTQVKIVARMSQGILNKLRLDTFRNILRMPMKLLDRHGTGRLITRSTNDIETVN